MCSKQKSRKSVRRSSSSNIRRIPERSSPTRSLSMMFRVSRLTDEFAVCMAWSISSLSVTCNSESSSSVALVSPHKALLATR